MAAEILEEVQEELSLTEGETQGDFAEENLAATPDPVAEQESQEEPEEEQDDIPEAYQGKSSAELSQMLQHAQQEIGRQGNEIGALRKSFEQMASQPSATASPETSEEVDYFVDPQKAVNQQINSHPALRQAQEMAQKLAYAEGLATLQQRHPDIKDVVGSEGFQNWVKDSPARISRYQRADQQGDVDEADDLISTYKAIKQASKSAEKVTKQARKQAVKNASVGSTRGAADGSGSRRIYRRADIRQLMRTDPARYEDLQPEIMRAYAEGRVRD
jgi:hypothetical protein